MTELISKIGDLVAEFLEYAVGLFNYILQSFKLFATMFNVFGGNQYTEFLNYIFYAFAIFLVIHYTRKLFSD